MSQIAITPKINRGRVRASYQRYRFAATLIVSLFANLGLAWLLGDCLSKKNLSFPNKNQPVYVYIEPPKNKPKEKIVVQRPTNTNKEVKIIKDNKALATGTSNKKNVGRPKKPRIARKKIKQRVVQKKEVKPTPIPKPIPKPFPKSDVPLDGISFNSPLGDHGKIPLYEQKQYKKLIAENRRLRKEIRREGGYALYFALLPLGKSAAPQRGNDDSFNLGGCRGCLRLFSPKVEKEVKKNEALKDILTNLKKFKKIKLTPDKKRRIIGRLIRLLKCDVCRREVAIEALTRFGRDARPAIPALRKVLKDADPELRKAAKRALQIIEASK